MNAGTMTADELEAEVGPLAGFGCYGDDRARVEELLEELVARVRAVEALQDLLPALERARARSKDPATVEAIGAVAELVRLNSPLRREILRTMEAPGDVRDTTGEWMGR